VRALALCGLLLALPSCSALRLEINGAFAAAPCAGFEEGRTRRAEVLAALGPPTDLAACEDGVAFLYERVVLDEQQLGISFKTVGALLGMPPLGLIKLSFGRSGARREVALLVFDADGVLSAVETGRWEEVFGRGGSLQAIVAVDQVVDLGTLRGLPHGLTWGREQLEPLPEALNQMHRPDLELRGTPDKAGQRSLEERDGGQSER